MAIEVQFKHVTTISDLSRKSSTCTGITLSDVIHFNWIRSAAGLLDELTAKAPRKSLHSYWP